ncbi:MAG: 4-(cytidine 5'-diphospho)-2-C-methyl-D-erythritol kinase [Eggerthellales bacterium]|nr:4-(cytidine 5'-diphospho)-2-C-methyl-D-erythritol kinase [Eggerthellales bacterium]
MNEFKVLAPAKVNLFLGIGEGREDGFHEVRTVLHALALHDVLTFAVVPEGGFDPRYIVRGGFDLPVATEEGISVGVDVVCHEGIELPEIPTEDNLVTKAIFALARACEVSWRGYIRVILDKHIPAQAGLGGGSSDAAAALLGAASIFGIPADDPRIAEVAATLGSDVPFFLTGGCAEYVGKGDQFVRSFDPMKDYVVIMIPEGATVPTAKAYELFDSMPVPIDPVAERDLSYVSEAFEVPIFNNLSRAAYMMCPGLEDVRRWARCEDGVDDVLLAGSGAAHFAICDDHDTADLLVVHARKKGYYARLTSFSSLRAAVVPKKD